jgi:hypothetical protein
MQNKPSSDEIESSALGWKFVAIVAGITTIFFTFLYLAMSVEPDYMPNREPKIINQQSMPVSSANTAQ